MVTNFFTPANANRLTTETTLSLEREIGEYADLFVEYVGDYPVSQPALSMQIKELEDELKVSLIERRKSGVHFTEHGEEVTRRAQAILASVRDLLDYAQHRDRVLSGSLKLGAIPSIAPYLLPAALPELQRR